MGKYEKLLAQILRGSSDTNIAFNDLCQLLRRLGFDENIRGSHHNFRKQGIEQKVNLQKDGNKAKAYQVKQVRLIIVENKLANIEGDI
jgi:predicted RNA binding protein YcfA (HicA-like mRNA interferase family)